MNTQLGNQMCDFVWSFLKIMSKLPEAHLCDSLIA